MLLTLHFVLLVLILNKNVQGNAQSFRSIHKFVVELRNDSDSMAKYVAQIQAIFCPDQPICGALALETRQDVMNTIPATINVENNTIPVDQLNALVGVCCLHCSCEDSCKDDDNCCLTKAFENKTIHVKTASSENSDCIGATSWRYYSSQQSTTESYFMLTKCSYDTNMSVSSNCESPNPYDMADTIPVTSLSSGRTYWNQHCAVCNDDADEIVFWETTVVFKVPFVFYWNSHGPMLYADSVEEFYNQLLRKHEIIFIPPFQMQHKRCIPEVQQKTCRKTRDDVQEAEHQFLYETCNMFTSPVISGKLMKTFHKNIFCLICDSERFVSPPIYECDFSGIGKQGGAMTALIDYHHLDETESSTQINPQGNGHCSCREIYDKYQENCRPVYCPPGSLYSGCRCTELLEAVFGMPLLLKLKVTPEPGSLYPSTDVLAAKFRKALQKAVKNHVGNVSVDTVASFGQQNETNSYKWYAAIIRSDFGHDTRETLKQLFDNLYAGPFLKVATNKNRYLVELENKIAIKHTHGQLVSAFDLQKQTELVLEYSNEEHYQIYQELSPILFCKQMELDDSEFTERDSHIIINTTSTVISLSDLYYTTAKQVRVCMDQYLPTPLMSSVNINGPVTKALIILLLYI